jgi:membrane-associated protease RseP (regulator of RpoE activity)
MKSAEAFPPFVDAPASYTHRYHRAARPTAREWRKHTALFLLTVATTTIAGVTFIGTNLISEPQIASPHNLLGYFWFIPQYYLLMVGAIIHTAFAYPALLAQGLTFSASLLAILTAHEAGHYVACRRYGVDATLPFFIPAPPLFLTGTFGAFIKIKSPIPSRRALFDIGLAGPIAGFIVATPIAVAGILTLPHGVAAAASDANGLGVTFNDPLFFHFIAHVFNIQLADAAPNAFYMAAWIGLLVTSLNLMPVGQLDGGHATYSVFGSGAHKWLGRAAFITMATLALLGWFWHSSPSGFLYAVLLAVMLRVRHPRPEDDEPLDRRRILIAALTLVIFILSFLPFPITLT